MLKRANLLEQAHYEQIWTVCIRYAFCHSVILLEFPEWDSNLAPQYWNPTGTSALLRIILEAWLWKIAKAPRKSLSESNLQTWSFRSCVVPRYLGSFLVVLVFFSFELSGFIFYMFYNSMNVLFSGWISKGPARSQVGAPCEKKSSEMACMHYCNTQYVYLFILLFIHLFIYFHVHYYFVLYIIYTIYIYVWLHCMLNRWMYKSHTIFKHIQTMSGGS